MAIVTELWFTPQKKNSNINGAEEKELEDLGFETTHLLCDGADIGSLCRSCGEVLKVPFVYFHLMEKGVCLCAECAQHMGNGLVKDCKTIQSQ